MHMKGCKEVEIKGVRESDGTLYVMECDREVPFEIKRIFFVRDVSKGVSRGDHATKKTRLILLPVSGTCVVTVDNGKEKQSFLMDSPSKGLLIEPMIWRSMKNFSEDCVMMAVCDRVFEPGNETYDDYDEYLVALSEGK